MVFSLPMSSSLLGVELDTQRNDDVPRTVQCSGTSLSEVLGQGAMVSRSNRIG